MASPSPTPLTAVQITAGTPEYQAIMSWPFPAEPFYVGQVLKLLQNDIPQRLMFSGATMWVYRDPQGETVGLGTLDQCKEYERFTNGVHHAYIPLLAVHPNFERRGHGQSIVQHLVAQTGLIRHCYEISAALYPDTLPFSDLLFLDVYVANQPAIKLYTRCGFAILNPMTPVLDPSENNEPYYIMASRVGVIEP